MRPLVVETLDEPVAYAQQLLGLARRQQFQPLSLSVTTMAGGGELAARIHAILDGDPTRQRLGRRRALVLAAMFPIAGVPGVAPMTPMRVAAHPAPALSFVSASMLRSPANRPLSMEARPDGRVLITGASLNRLLRLAYGVQDHGIVGVPAWAHTERFDLLRWLRQARRRGTYSPCCARYWPSSSLCGSSTRSTSGSSWVLTRRDTSHRAVAAVARLRPPALSPTSPTQAEGSAPARQLCGFRVAHGRLEGTGVTLDALAATLSTPLGRAVWSTAAL